MPIVIRDESESEVEQWIVESTEPMPTYIIQVTFREWVNNGDWYKGFFTGKSIAFKVI